MLVSILYIFIVAALYYGVAPFKMRESIKWLYGNSLRVRLLGATFSGMGLALLVCAMIY